MRKARLFVLFLAISNIKAVLFEGEDVPLDQVSNFISKAFLIVFRLLFDCES